MLTVEKPSELSNDLFDSLIPSNLEVPQCLAVLDTANKFSVLSRSNEIVANILIPSFYDLGRFDSKLKLLISDHTLIHVK